MLSSEDSVVVTLLCQVEPTIDRLFTTWLSQQQGSLHLWTQRALMQEVKATG